MEGVRGDRQTDRQTRRDLPLPSPVSLQFKVRVRCFPSGDQGVHIQTPLLLFEVADCLFRDQVKA